MIIDYSRYEEENVDRSGLDSDTPKNIYDLAEHLSRNANGGYFSGFSSFGNGVKLGLYLRREHQTLQGVIVNFLLGILCSLANQEYTDPRNEEAINSCKHIQNALESDEIHVQPYI